MTTRDIRNAALRGHLDLFLLKVFEMLHPGQPVLALSPYLRAICHHLVAATIGDILRLVITVPPRHLKSISASVALTAWLLGRDPAMKIMVATYSQDLARQHAENCRTIMESAWYRALFPKTRIAERGNRQLEVTTTAGGMRKAVSVGGSVTGFGADLIIVDDCMKSDEAGSQAARDQLFGWFDGTLLTRLNDKANGRIISIQQRLHEDDLPARLLEQGYHHLNLPAIAERLEVIPSGLRTIFRREPGNLLNPARENHDVLERMRRELGPMVFSAQYQQNPTVPEGNLIRLEWFPIYEGSFQRYDLEKVVQSWDTAATSAPTSDWSVGMTWGLHDGCWYLLDVIRQRFDYPDLKRAVLRQIHVWKPDKVLIEHASTGLPLAQELRQEGKVEVMSGRFRGDKQERLIAQTAELETGRFVFPEQAPWLNALLSELRSFPNGKHDDQVDALSQFVHFQKVNFRWVSERRNAKGRIIGNDRTRFRSPYTRRSA